MAFSSGELRDAWLSDRWRFRQGGGVLVGAFRGGEGRSVSVVGAVWGEGAFLSLGRGGDLVVFSRGRTVGVVLWFAL